MNSIATTVRGGPLAADRVNTSLMRRPIFLDVLLYVFFLLVFIGPLLTSETNRAAHYTGSGSVFREVGYMIILLVVIYIGARSGNISSLIGRVPLSLMSELLW